MRGAIAPLGLLLLWAGCPGPYRPLARCGIAASEGARLVPAALFSNQAGSVSPLSLAPRPVRCANDSGATECESVDDLTALEQGAGFVCGPGGLETAHVCPPLPARARREPPSSGDKPCGAAACDNVQLAVALGDGVTGHLLFYDDPSCHVAAPAPVCDKAARGCHYRLRALTLEWSGKAW